MAQGGEQKWWQSPRHRFGLIGAVVVVLVIVALVDDRRGDGRKSAAHDVGSASASAGASGSPSESPSGGADSGAASASASASPVPSVPSVPKNVLPDLVGADLQKAWDGARAAGYRFVTMHDASGRGRRQFLYSSWKVCDQKPGPGPIAKELTVELGVVRHDEKCPAGSGATTEPKVVEGRVPDLTGRSVNVVRAALRGDAHVKADDLAGDRPVLVETHWMVCTQKPAAGQPLPGTVEVGVVKYGERCP